MNIFGYIVDTGLLLAYFPLYVLFLATYIYFLWLVPMKGFELNNRTIGGYTKIEHPWKRVIVTHAIVFMSCWSIFGIVSCIDNVAATQPRILIQKVNKEK